MTSPFLDETWGGARPVARVGRSGPKGSEIPKKVNQSELHFFAIYVLDFITYSHLIMTFCKRRNVVQCFIIYYRKILLLNVLLNLYLFESELTRALSKQCEHSTPLLDAQVGLWDQNYAFISSRPSIGCGELQNIANMYKNVKTHPKKGIPLLY